MHGYDVYRDYKGTFYISVASTFGEEWTVIKSEWDQDKYNTKVSAHKNFFFQKQSKWKNFFGGFGGWVLTNVVPLMPIGKIIQPFRGRRDFYKLIKFF